MSKQLRKTEADVKEDSKNENTHEGTDVGECPECESDDVTIDGDETICGSCGLVISEDNIDRGPEWRAFNQSERSQKSRTGSGMTKMLHDEGLSSKISWENKDANGNQISQSKRRQMSRLRKWDERTRAKSSTERNLKNALGEIQRMSSALGLPDDVREVAATIYRRALDEDLIRGRSIESTATASVYAAATQCGIPRGYDEINAVSQISEDEWTRNYRYLLKELNLGIEPNKPSDFLPKYASELNLSQEHERITKKILRDAEKTNVISGKSRVGLVAAAIYIGGLYHSGDKMTQQEIARVIDTTEVTIRNRYKELIENIDSDEIGKIKTDI